MSETPDPDEFADIPTLARSITDNLTNLCAHAHSHGEEAERTGETPEQMPECLASHVGSLSAVLFGLTRPEAADSSITCVVEIPGSDGIPEGLIEGLQKVIGEELAKIGKQS